MRALDKTRRSRPARSPGPRDVHYYNLMMFATPFMGMAFCRRVAEVVAAYGERRFTAGGQRATLWIAPTGLADSSCYVYASDAALDAAKAVGIEPPIVGYALATELPPSRCLYLGDMSALSPADRKAQSASLLALCLAGTRQLATGHPLPRGTADTPGTDRAEVF